MSRQKKQKSSLSKIADILIYIFTLPLGGALLLGPIGFIIGVILGIFGLVHLSKNETKNKPVEKEESKEIKTEETNEAKIEESEEIIKEENKDEMTINKEMIEQKWFAWVVLAVGGILLGVVAGVGWLAIPVFFYLIWNFQHHGKKMRIVITVFFSIVLINAIGSGGDDDEKAEGSEENEVKEERFNVEINENIQVTDDLATIELETNLLDGSEIYYEVKN